MQVFEIALQTCSSVKILIVNSRITCVFGFHDSQHSNHSFRQSVMKPSDNSAIEDHGVAFGERLFGNRIVIDHSEGSKQSQEIR